MIYVIDYDKERLTLKNDNDSVLVVPRDDNFYRPDGYPIRSDPNGTGFIRSVVEVPTWTDSSTSINSQLHAELKYLQTSLLPKKLFENREGSRADVLVRAPDAGT